MYEKFKTLNLLLSCFLLSYILLTNKCDAEREKVKIIAKTDTFIISKVDTVYKMIEKTIRTPSPKAQSLIKYIKIDDSAKTLPLTVKTYEDSVSNADGIKVNYKAIISGFQPNLDSISFTAKLPVITKNQLREVSTTETIKTTNKQRPKITFGPTIGIGYGIMNHNIDAYVGLSVTIPIYFK